MNRFFLVFFCAVQLASASQRAVVNKCCSNRYSILLASCSKPADDGDAGDVETDENEVIATGRSISVHSNQGNQTRDGDFEFTTQLIQCPDGHIVKHDFSFQLRDDGSLVTSWGNFSNGEFCLGQSAEREDPRGLVARFCVKDPCRQTSCLRKCCPLGMAVDLQAKECRPYWKEFDFEIRNEDGTLANSTGVLIVDGVTAPVCEDGINILRPDLYEDSDQFYVLPSGQLKIPAYDSDESITDVYCVDDFFSGNITRAAMICFPPTVEDSPNIYIYRYFMIVSAIFLIITFMVYAVLPEIQNIHGVTIMCHVASLAVMYITFALIQLHVGVYFDSTSTKICIALAVIAHFTWLASFTWLNVMSFDIWLTFTALRVRSSRQNGRRHRLGTRFLMYSIYAWGVPTLIVTVGQILDYSPNLPDNIIRPNFGVEHCWFKDNKAQVAYLYGPIGIIILSNIVLFILTAVQLYRASIDTAFATNNNRNKQKFRVIFSLFILMGVSWTMEIISFAAGGVTADWIWIPTDIINILTGLFIFIIFVCKRKVWELLKKKWTTLERLDKMITRSGRFTINRGPEMRDTSTSVLSKSQHHDHFNKNEKISCTQSIHVGDSTQIDSADDRPDSRLTGNMND